MHKSTTVDSISITANYPHALLIYCYLNKISIFWWSDLTRVTNFRWKWNHVPTFQRKTSSSYCKQMVKYCKPLNFRRKLRSAIGGAMTTCSVSNCEVVGSSPIRASSISHVSVVDGQVRAPITLCSLPGLFSF